MTLEFLPDPSLAPEGGVSDATTTFTALAEKDS